ncbi:conserved hypothetical protein [Neospora caninum Liverpool]|uniref:Uncharacterized protein n=1 Tax=Neospora caninum (strain Liverpool) TaxID=572307 RepID=F0VCR2_NEOCL|nr:conserved hypothetical protein [Neospora caninum Liverpool]CBZ51427.1 conserved hypothetical protein [Neospora caninum Liverpool]CEL65375.1 TPA: hypothetical protein BN1204_012250 [Neospora caninum Liverpool]|eukprot:XP_003881460.1 conserved hypothetical protein [Neospora caninum Liverpool]
MVYGIVIFATEGSVPLFSSFYTPEGNDEQMRKREQAVIRRVVEDHLFQVQCTRDVLLACTPSPPAPPSSTASTGSSSLTINPYGGKRLTGAGAGSRSWLDAPHHPAGNGAAGTAGKAAEAESMSAPGGVRTAGGGGAGFRRKPRGGPEPSALEAAEAAAKRREAAVTAANIAAAEVMEGVLLLQRSSLFASPKVVVWKHVESISYALICGAVDNILLGANFLTLFIHCLAESFASDKIISTQLFAQQLLSRPDLILLVLHFLLPGGQLIFINGSQAKFLKGKIKAALDQKKG